MQRQRNENMNATPAVRRPMKTIKADDVVSSFRFPFLAAHSARAKDDSRMPTAYDLQYPSIKFKRFSGFHMHSNCAAHGGFQPV